MTAHFGAAVLECILGTSMILCFTSAEEDYNDETCQEKQG